jgi:hypothetical protein
MTKKRLLTLAAFVALLILSVFFSNRDPSLDEEWSPQLPNDIAQTIEAKYSDDIKKQKAALQFANALWMVIGPGNDTEVTTPSLARSVTCLFAADLSEDQLELRSLVLSTRERIKAYLENDSKWHGRVFHSIDPETSCDE